MHLAVLYLFLVNFILFHQKVDPCEDAKAGAGNATTFAKDSVFNDALRNIKSAFISDQKEHAIAFGKDPHNNIFSSGITNGNENGASVPAIINGFADLHNHPNNLPPDAGDLYGLIDINTRRKEYDSRFVVTAPGAVYALLITDTVAVAAFNTNHSRQVPAFAGGPPGFPEAIVDEYREMKYQYNCTDEMALAFILEKYNAGISLLKQDSRGAFKKLRTIISKDAGRLIFKAANCQ